MISEEIGLELEKVTLDDLGSAKKVTINKDNTTIVDGAAEPSALQDRIAQIQHQLEHTTSQYDRDKLQQRIAKLSGGVAVIKIGAATEVEMKEKKIAWMMHCTPLAPQWKKGLWPAVVSLC